MNMQDFAKENRDRCESLHGFHYTLATLVQEGELAAGMTGRFAVDAFYKRLSPPERGAIGVERFANWAAQAEANIPAETKETQ